MESDGKLPTASWNKYLVWSVGPTIQPAELKKAHRQADRHKHTWTLPKILPLLLKREVNIKEDY